MTSQSICIIPECLAEGRPLCPRHAHELARGSERVRVYVIEHQRASALARRPRAAIAVVDPAAAEPPPADDALPWTCPACGRVSRLRVRGVCHACYIYWSRGRERVVDVGRWFLIDATILAPMGQPGRAAARWDRSRGSAPGDDAWPEPLTRAEEGALAGRLSADLGRWRAGHRVAGIRLWQLRVLRTVDLLRSQVAHARNGT